MTLETLSDSNVFSTLLALALLLGGAYIGGRLMEAIRAPKVIGEILGGMLFGGTFLYHFFPGAMEGIFQAYPEEGKVLNLVYQFGLIFLMFCGRIGSFTFALSLKGHKVEPPVKLPEENPTIGIILCRDKNNAVVEMTLPEDNSQIFASKYETVLPSKEALQKLLQEQISDEDGGEGE